MAQTGRPMRKGSIIGILLVILLGCNPNRRTPEEVDLSPAPVFHADSAFHFLTQQVAFGPRIPGTSSHDSCGNYLVRTLARYGFDVSEQKDTIAVYGDKVLPVRNIHGTINPLLKERILLCAHWDSRPYADQDNEGKHLPIEGANDNASGVAVLLEIARCMSEQQPNVGVDIVFFDLEDQGRPASDTPEDPNDHGFCKGSEYWAQHAVASDYRFGILLDMVGAKDAVFSLEGTSFRAAPDLMYRVWDMGHQIGHGSFFVYNRTLGVFDDHVPLIRSGIPTINILHQDIQTLTLFGRYWHTHDDNLDLIDPKTLEAVGQTVIQVVYNSAEE